MKKCCSSGQREKKPYEYKFMVVYKGMTLFAFHEKSHIRFTHALPVHIKISLMSDAEIAFVTHIEDTLI